MRTKIGMVFQHFELFPHLTALQNVTIAPIKIQKRDREEVEDNAKGLFKKVGLENRMDHFPYQLSGGQKQRIAILRALAMDPDIILFDEPTSALDPEMVKDVLYVMKDLSMGGMTMIVVTHELGFAKEVASHVTFFEDGQIVETKNPDEFFRGNGSERTKIFLNNIINV
jgi:polar amino acid transport system ATP-binding protein